MARKRGGGKGGGLRVEGVGGWGMHCVWCWGVEILLSG